MLEVANLSKRYGTGDKALQAIKSLTFTVEPGEFACIVGPSGCGKSTLLKCLSGLIQPTGGYAKLDGQEITRPPEKMALVFQDYTRSLLPWMTVHDNVTLPIKLQKGARSGSRSSREERARHALEAVGLDDFTHRYPWQLSGGMQQRVAIARALAYQPEVLLMDEPFASVDAQTRNELEDLTLRVWNEFGITIVLVTHDIDESVYMADHVVVLDSAPSVVQEVVRVKLPRPRDQVATKEMREFADARRRVYELITSKQVAGSAS